MVRAITALRSLPMPTVTMPGIDVRWALVLYGMTLLSAAVGGQLANASTIESSSSPR